MTAFEKQMLDEFMKPQSKQPSYDLQAYKHKAMYEPIVYKKVSK